MWVWLYQRTKECQCKRERERESKKWKWEWDESPLSQRRSLGIKIVDSSHVIIPTRLSNSPSPTFYLCLWEGKEIPSIWRNMECHNICSKIYRGNCQWRNDGETCTSSMRHLTAAKFAPCGFEKDPKVPNVTKIQNLSLWILIRFS